MRLALKCACCRHMQNVRSYLPGWQQRQEGAGASGCLAEAVSQKNAELHSLPSLTWSSGHAVVIFSWSNALIEGEAWVPSVSSFWNLSSSTCWCAETCNSASTSKPHRAVRSRRAGNFSNLAWSSKTLNTPRMLRVGALASQAPRTRRMASWAQGDHGAEVKRSRGMGEPGAHLSVGHQALDLEHAPRQPVLDVHQQIICVGPCARRDGQRVGPLGRNLAHSFRGSGLVDLVPHGADRHVVHMQTLQHLHAI